MLFDGGGPDTPAESGSWTAFKFLKNCYRQAVKQGLGNPNETTNLMSQRQVSYTCALFKSGDKRKPLIHPEMADIFTALGKRSICETKPFRPGGAGQPPSLCK